MVEILSPHLTVAEFTGTSYRELLPEQMRIWNDTPALRDSAARFASQVFEPVRLLLGPLHVNSGYRCPDLNTRVGGSPNSRHMLALAADVVPTQVEIGKAMRMLAGAISAGALPDVDQAIIEMNSWLHIQGSPPGKTPRRMALFSPDGKTFQQFA